MNKKNFTRKGFSLVELVVVLTVILVAVVVVRFAFDDKDNPQQLAQAEQIVGSFLRIARLKALAEAESPKGEPPFRKARTRLIIHADPSSPEKYLRFMGVVYGDGDEQRWYSEIDGIYLPKGVYAILPEGIDLDNQIMRLEYPKGSGSSRLQLNEKGEKWLFYEFSKFGLSDCINRKCTLKIAQGRQTKMGELKYLDASSVVTFQFSNNGKAIASSRRMGY